METIKNTETNRSSDLMEKHEITTNNQINPESEREKKCHIEIAQEKKEKPTQIVKILLNGAEKSDNKTEVITNEEPILNVEPLKEDEADFKKQTDTAKLLQCIIKPENDVKIKDESKEPSEIAVENKECCVTLGKVLLETWI